MKDKAYALQKSTLDHTWLKVLWDHFFWDCKKYSYYLTDLIELGSEISVNRKKKNSCSYFALPTKRL